MANDGSGFDHRSSAIGHPPSVICLLTLALYPLPSAPCPLLSTLCPRKPMKALRVCHLGKYYPPAAGGIETHVRTLARAQAGLGASVRVYCINHRRGPTIV